MERKILILTSDTGGGHTSAARALEAGLGHVVDGVSFLVHIAHALEESHSLTRRMAGLYNVLLRSQQKYVKHYHWFVNRFHPDRWPFVYKHGKKYLSGLVDRHCPNVIVSVHPMVQYCLSRMLEELKLADKIPLVTVVTDPCGNSWSGWRGDHVNLYIVAHEWAKQELISFGIPEDKIRICGMPIHPKFQDVSERDPAIARLELGLNPEKFTVFVNAGWVGGGNIPQIYSTLIEADLDLQMIFLAGRNEKLEKEAKAMARNASFPISVIGYTDKMDHLMSASSLMISKLGGLTTFEALASQLPIIADGLTPPMPQEAGTGNLLEEYNAGVMLRRLDDIVPIVRRLLHDTDEYLAMKQAAAALGIPDATKRIVNEISNLIPSQTPAPAVELIQG